MRWTRRATSLLCTGGLLAGCYHIPPRLDPQLAPAAIGDTTADGMPCAPLEGHRLYRVADAALGQAEEALGDRDLAAASPALAADLVPGALTVPLMIDGSGDGGDHEADRRRELAIDPTLSDPKLKEADLAERNLAADTWLAKSRLVPYVVRTVMAEDRAGSYRACWAGTVLHVNFVSAGVSIIPFVSRPIVIMLSEPPSAVVADIVDRVPVEEEPRRAFQIFFDFASADLTAGGRQVVRAAADAAKSGRTVHILVTGHTDSVGPTTVNQLLSERRAESVAQELVADGVPATEIATRGVGKSDPLVPTADGTREAQNRRATIELDPQASI
jgi:outer membrane protein OmpA-like peptidoglycan-associated protein